MRAVRQTVAVMVASTAVTVAGCGSGGSHSAPTTSSGSSNSASAPPNGGSGSNGSGSGGGGSGGGGSGGGQRITLPDPGPTGKPADPAAVKVIRGWSDSLRRGDVAAAALYFALPSEMINGPDANGLVSVLAIRSRRAAEAANATLPCGARFLRADQRGRYVNALFALTSRPGIGGGCEGPNNGRGRVNFIIRSGKIVQWLRAPDEPGDQPPGPGQRTPPGSAPPPSGGLPGSRQAPAV